MSYTFGRNTAILKDVQQIRQLIGSNTVVTLFFGGGFTYLGCQGKG